MSKIADKITALNYTGNIWSDETERAQTLYFNWLCNLVHIDNYCKESWYVFGKILHNIEFYWTVTNDDNRAADGVKLRETWLSSMDNEAEDLGIGHPAYPANALNGPCTMLEMMVALAVRIESDIMQDSKHGNRTANWFWDMIRNVFNREIPAMFTYDFCDRDITAECGEVIRERIRIVLDREYGEDGLGGLFPLLKYDQDQREVEIWYQAQYWLKENYPETFY